MHPNPAFRQTDADRNLTFARQRGFGVLTAAGPEGPLASHLPFVLSDDGSTAEMHLVRSTALTRAHDAPMPALLAVSGPDGYVSPDWYDIGHDQVPTWNYVAVHLRGRLERLPDEALRGVLDRQTAAFEARLAPKKPWTIDKVPDEALARLMRQIVPFRLVIEDVQGTWKLNQNKPDEARLRAADAMAASPLGMEMAALAAWMRAGEPS